MRIAYVIPRLHKHGGTEVGIAMLVEDLSAHHALTVISHSLDEVSAPGVRFHRMPMVAKPATARYLSFLLANALLMPTAVGVRAFDIVHSSGADTVYANVATAQFCQAERLSLLRNGTIRLHTETKEQRARRAEALLFGAITSFTERAIYRSRRVRRVIAVSRGVKGDLLRRYGLEPEKVTVIPNAVDGARFSPANRSLFRAEIRSRHGLGEGEVALLFVAHEWERKGLPLVLEALARLPEPTRRRTRLLIVGRGNRRYYGDRAARLGVADRVVFAGETDDVRQYYAAGDLLVFPSYYEAFSLVTLEAAASGLPLVASRINGTEELVADGKNGFFVRHDPADIAARLELLVENDELRAEMGGNARASVASYSRAEVARRTLQVYEQVISR